MTPIRMYVCMYVCMCIYTFIYVYALCVCMYVCMHACVYVCIYHVLLKQTCITLCYAVLCYSISYYLEVVVGRVEDTHRIRAPWVALPV